MSAIIGNKSKLQSPRNSERIHLYCQNLEFTFTNTNFLLTGRSPLRRRKSALDCSAIEEDDEEDYKLSVNIIHILKLL